MIFTPLFAFASTLLLPADRSHQIYGLPAGETVLYHTIRENLPILKKSGKKPLRPPLVSDGTAKRQYRARRGNYTGNPAVDKDKADGKIRNVWQGNPRQTPSLGERSVVHNHVAD
jgi:hypothetical protein